MYREHAGEILTGPREWQGWVNIIDQGLGLSGHRLSESAVAQRLLTRSSGDESMDQATCNALWSEAALLSGEPALGLMIGSIDVQLPLTLQMLGLTAAASLDMRSAISNLTRFFGLISTQAGLELHAGQGPARLLLRPRGRPHEQHMAALAGIVGSMLQRFARRCGVADPKLALGLNTLPDGSALPDWCESLEHAETCQILLPQQWLDLGLPDAAPGLLNGMTFVLHGVLARMPAGEVVERVRHAIQLHMARGCLAEEQIAGPMGISTRHLRRLLRQHHTSYERLLDETRRETALRLLDDPRSSLTRIAYELGFQDPSSFTRAFRRWTGCSPSDFRRRHAG